VIPNRFGDLKPAGLPSPNLLNITRPVEHHQTIVYFGGLVIDAANHECSMLMFRANVPGW
jgi:hypothetical protein